MDSTESLLSPCQCCQLRGSNLANFRIEKPPGSPYGTYICPPRVTQPCGVESVGLSPLVPVATEGLQEHAVALRLPIAPVGWQLEGRSLSIKEIGYGKQ